MIGRVVQSRLSGWLLIVALLSLWEFATATKLIDLISVPRFSRVIAAAVPFVTTGELFEVLGPSLYRLAIAYTLAIAIGTSMGMLMGSFRFINNLFEPIVEMLRPLPSAALIPIIILLLGLGDQMKIAMVTFAATFPILINTHSGVRSVDPVQINTARTLGLHERGILFKVVLPAASPFIVTGMRISLAVALVLVIVSEMLTGGGGIGYFILDTQRSFRVPETYVGIATIGVLGYSINRLFLALQRLLIGWHLESRRVESA